MFPSMGVIEALVMLYCLSFLTFFFLLLIGMQTDPESYSIRRSNSCLMQAAKCTKLEHLKLIKFTSFTSRENEISMAEKLTQLVKGKPPNIKASDGSCLNAVFMQSFFISNTAN